MKNIELEIIYEDKELLVLNKPTGLITHPKNADDMQDSVTGWLIQKYPFLKDIGEPFIASGKEVERAGVVHRLDKDTSGLILAAKNNEAFFYLKNLFQERKIKKYYLALVNGRPKEPKGIISSPLGRIGLKRTTKITGKKLIDKKEALTEYRTLKEFPVPKGRGLASDGKNYTLLEVTPRTGRTHQIRVHLNSIGTPISGDTVYGFKKVASPPNLKRLFLHAYKLEFRSPDKKSLVIECDLPDDLQKVINELE